jgi:hypothetical protein
MPARSDPARAAVVAFFSLTNHADDGTLAADYEYLETIGRVGDAEAAGRHER